MLSIQQLHPQLATAAYQYFLEGKKLLSVKDTAEILVCFPDVGLTEAAVKPQWGVRVSLTELHSCSLVAAHTQVI